MDVTAIVQFALLIANILLLGCQAKPDKPTLSKLDEVLTCTKAAGTDCTSDTCTYKFYHGDTSGGGTLVKEVTAGNTPQTFDATQNGPYVCVLKKDGDNVPSDDSTAVIINTYAKTPVIKLVPDSPPVCGFQNLTVECEKAATSAIGEAATHFRLMKDGASSAIVDWTPVADIAQVVTTISPLLFADKDTKYTCQAAVDKAGTKEKESTSEEKTVACSDCSTGDDCKDSPLGRTTCNDSTKDCEAPKPTTPAPTGQSTGQSVQTSQTDQTEQTSQKSGGDDSGSGTQKMAWSVYLASLGTIITLMTFLQRG